VYHIVRVVEKGCLRRILFVFPRFVCFINGVRNGADLSENLGLFLLIDEDPLLDTG
jgi:hypothetical protein